MCGIVGYVGARQAVPVIVEGLRRLEYRGYDSCGVAIHAGGGLRRARSTSRVHELEAQVALEHVAGTTGIAHTRWATHGAPLVHNAHPHFSHGPHATAYSPGRIALALLSLIVGPLFVRLRGDYFALVPMDNSSWCKCSACVAELNADEEKSLHFSNGWASDYVFGFANKVARAISTVMAAVW